MPCCRSLSAIQTLPELCSPKGITSCDLLDPPTCIFLLSSLQHIPVPFPPSLSPLYTAARSRCLGNSFGDSDPEDRALISDSRTASRPSKPPMVIMRSLRTGPMLMLKGHLRHCQVNLTHLPWPHSSSYSPKEPRTDLLLWHRHASNGEHAFCPRSSPRVERSNDLYSIVMFLIYRNLR